MAAEAARPTCLPPACGGALPQASVTVRAACLCAWLPAGQVAKQHCSLEACRAYARCVVQDIGQTVAGRVCLGVWRRETANTINRKNKETANVDTYIFSFRILCLGDLLGLGDCPSVRQMSTLARGFRLKFSALSMSSCVLSLSEKSTCVCSSCLSCLCWSQRLAHS